MSVSQWASDKHKEKSPWFCAGNLTEKFYIHELSCTLISCFLHWFGGAPSGHFHVTVTATVQCIAMQLYILYFFFCTIRILNEWMNNQPIKLNKSPCLTFSEDIANNYPSTVQSVILKTQAKCWLTLFCVYNMLVFISSRGLI